MRDIKTKESQVVLNKINSKVDFTHEFGVDAYRRYVVGSKPLYKGTNPSLDLGILDKIVEVLHEPLLLDSIGGWMNNENGEYCVDANMHFDDIDQALKMAKIWEQVAIFDKERNEVLYINENKN